MLILIVVSTADAFILTALTGAGIIQPEPLANCPDMFTKSMKGKQKVMLTNVE